MFTGIVEECGTVRAIIRRAKGAVLHIEAKRVLEDVAVGDSIAVNGVCLTVTQFSSRAFWADVMPTTLAHSSLGSLQPQSCVNLERALAANGRFGGHIVSGHIDGLGTISDIRRDGNATRYRIKAEASQLRYIVQKGSIAIDGISLTVVDVTPTDFSVSIIPHTGHETTLSLKKEGDTVNLECDILGKYVEKLLLQAEQSVKREPGAQSTLDRAFLTAHGF